MKTPRFSRRTFVKNTALAAATWQLTSALRAAGESPVGAATPSSVAAAPGAAGGDEVALRWLDGQTPAALAGVTWGVPWPRGRCSKATKFALHTAAGAPVPVQSWPTAYWPDGSLKWTAHAIPAAAGGVDSLRLSPGVPAAPAAGVTVRESADTVEIDTGAMVCRVAKQGAALILSLVRDGREIARDGRLVCLRQEQPEVVGDGAVRQEAFASTVEQVTVEQRGPVRAVVKITGRHVNAAGRAWLPFTVRLYFYSGGDAVRLMHSFVFDGDEAKDFICGLGVRFAVPMRDLPHDRHVRFVGEGAGLWAEAVRGLTGLRRDPGAAAKQAQLAGRACPPVAELPENVRTRLDYIPAWGDFTLCQSAANAFAIRKRTKPGHGWIDVDQGRRAAGVGFVGGATGGGVAFGLRDFWQRHPTQLDIRGANTEAAEVTLWLWSPAAPPMDLRFYHDGLGMDTFEKQYNGGLEITYEDYEPGWGTAHGTARTSELMLWALPATPTRERLVELAEAVRTPPLLVCEPARFLAARVFGALWGPPDRSTPEKAALENRIDLLFDFYRQQVEQRHWYGFWNYGDVMHTYDADRHVWRYDVGGFAWDNSELSPDLWLWYAFLRSGRADLFRFAEAMTRHTGEVDVYHAGRFSGLGTRHNVQHWGCSAKQVRISNAAYRRFYYYLTADERVGDLLRELLDGDAKLEMVDPARKLKNMPPRGQYPARISVGTDWCSLAAAWLTEWERGGDLKYRDKLLTGMKDIGAATHGFFSGERFGYDPTTGHLYNILGNEPAASHLSAVFGAMEICGELIQLTEGQPEFEPFERAWLQYCVLYNGTPEQQQAALGRSLRGLGLTQAHSRLTAYAAWRKKDPELARRAWDEFARGGLRSGLSLAPVNGPTVLNPVQEAAGVSTNDTAQWCLAAMQNLALIGDYFVAK
ncbi:MAG: Tat pathway signal sequence domain protein [Opitutae bacterium]|nr:Tat pathway signal sequence domain protein [Opitutae bacterium]